MTIEGVTGYGYSNQGSTSQDNQPRSAENTQGLNVGGVQVGAQAEDRAEELVQDADYEVPGYEGSASICFKRAADIARSLNHTNLTADHLMLALTMDPNARRLLERVGDVTQLREAAMQRLGHYGSARNSSEQSSKPTSDLADIAKKARDAANEREQSVAISDLINAFPQIGGPAALWIGRRFQGDRVDGKDRDGTGAARLGVHRMTGSRPSSWRPCSRAKPFRRCSRTSTRSSPTRPSRGRSRSWRMFAGRCARRSTRRSARHSSSSAMTSSASLTSSTAEPEVPDEPTQPEPSPEQPVTPQRSRANPLSWLALL